MDTVEIIKNLFVQAGAGWVLWLLFFLSGVSLAIAFERLLYFGRKGEDVRALTSTLDAYLSDANWEAALELLRPLRSVASTIAKAGLRLAPRGLVAAERGMQSALAYERKLLETRLVFLGTLGNNAPFIGLFGTVIGVILAFEELGQVGSVGSGMSAGPSHAVMGAIAEALVATAVGIAVALPSVVAYNYFQRRIASLLDDAETMSTLVLAYLGAVQPEVDAGPRRGAPELRGIE